MKNKNESHHHSGSYMVRRNLYSIHKFAAMLLEMIDEHDEIESWMEHKISVAKAAISDVKDAFMYDKEEGDMAHDDDHSHPHMKIAILRKADGMQDDFGLNKIMGGCGSSNETRSYLGSATMNEHRQIISQTLNKKIFAESAEKIGNMIRIKTKSGETYEYVPYLGADLEILRCEEYKVKVKKKLNEYGYDKNPKSDDSTTTLAQSKDGMTLFVFNGEPQIVMHGGTKATTKEGYPPDYTFRNNNIWIPKLEKYIGNDHDVLRKGHKLVVDGIPTSLLDQIQEMDKNSRAY